MFPSFDDNKLAGGSSSILEQSPNQLNSIYDGLGDYNKSYLQTLEEFSKKIAIYDRFKPLE